MYKIDYIDRIGIELEGGWNSTEYHARARRFPIGADGSVSIDARGVLEGEVRSRPLKRLGSIKRWLIDRYPQYVNSSCGMHVHISLKKKEDYIKLTNKKFYDFFLKKMEIWGNTRLRHPDDQSLWKERLTGNNGFCKREFVPKLQIRESFKSSYRYTQLNYCLSYHGTLECRLFPMFKRPLTAFSALINFLDIVETYLQSNKTALKKEYTITFKG